jgi:hypothetical protein
MTELPSIHTSTIYHKHQRYDTAGDYYDIGPGKQWIMHISRLGDWRYEALILIHELVEMCLTKNDGVDWSEIDHFDVGDGKESNDPGMLQNAPYHFQHMKATDIEQQMAIALGVDWDEYNKVLDGLEY